MLRSKGAERVVAERLAAMASAVAAQQQPSQAQQQEMVVVEMIIRLSATTADLPFDGNVLLFAVGHTHRGVRCLTDVLEGGVGPVARTVRPPTLRHLNEGYAGLPDYTHRFLRATNLFKTLDAKVKAGSATALHVHWDAQQGLAAAVEAATTADCADSVRLLCEDVRAWAMGLLEGAPQPAAPTSQAAVPAEMAAAEPEAEVAMEAAPEQQPTPEPDELPKSGDVIYVLGRNRKVSKHGTVVVKGQNVPVAEALAQDRAAAAAAGSKKKAAA